jgi:hypothetical protein
MDALLDGKAGTFARDSDYPMIDPTDWSYIPISVILLHAVVFSVFTLAALSSNNSILGIFSTLKGWVVRPMRNRSY